MRVRIVFVTDEAGEVDTDRVGTIEDMPDDEAKRLIREGVAVEATAKDFEEFEARQAYENSIAEDRQAVYVADTPERSTAKPRRTTTPAEPAGGPDPADPDGSL